MKQSRALQTDSTRGQEFQGQAIHGQVLEVPSFQDQCYRLLKEIPRGKVTTYAEMARALGTRAWRAVGTAMAKNTQLVVIPCHRVVRSDGRVGDYALGTEKKIGLLVEEGVEIRNGRVTDFDKYIHRF